MMEQDVQGKEGATPGIFGKSAVQASDAPDAPGEGGHQGGGGEGPPVQAKASGAAAAPLFSHFAEDGPAVQRKGAGREGAVHQAAAMGTTGSGGDLPFKDQIQKSFGGHDVSSVKAHTGGAAEAATKQMGATAYASGNNVAFGKSPDLHTAAHEAAHVVQQRGGVQLKGGVGQAGDHYEKNADAVADRVVQGKSAEDLLDPVAGKSQGAGDSVQQKKKSISGKAMARVTLAKEAIAHAKSVFAFGAGNQMEALQASNFNSYFRMKVMRDPSCWIMADSVRAIASQNYEALTAAKADLAHGGNCGEHAQVGFDYLRFKAAGQKINLSDVEGLDHAFVIMGDLGSESDGDLAVCDPWPSAATATVWEDHFAFTADRKKINARHSMVADGKNVKAIIAAGLKLSDKGKQMCEQAMSKQQTDKEIKSGTEGHGWIWQHQDAAAQGKKYDYKKK